MSIEVENVTKTYKIYNNNQMNIFKKLFRPEFELINAVDDISFSINDGEFVGYIGSNGAGKSTTLKMLSGILVPTQGKIIVNGISPSNNRTKHAKQIGIVFGQRSQLLWDLPVRDTLNLYKKMYQVTKDEFNENMDMLNDILEINTFIEQPARQLSLGQKMKANIALALIHNPQILFLDEPTIGLDVLAKDNLRKILKAINKKRGTTIVLTTHDLSDIQELCGKIILIDKGKIIFNGKKDCFLQKFSQKGVIKLTFSDSSDEIKSTNFRKIESEGKEQIYEFNKNELSELEAIKYIVNNYDIQDIKIDSVTIESVVKDIFLRKVL